MKFELFEDIKVCTWRRYTYEVEANSLEEAVEMVKDGSVDNIDATDLYGVDEFPEPSENNGYPTYEIYSAKDDKLLYSNGER